MKVLSAENPKLSAVLSLKPGVGQNIAKHASPTAGNLSLAVYYLLSLPSTSFPPPKSSLRFLFVFGGG